LLRSGLLCACLLGLGLAFGAGCAAPAAPQPPTLNLPEPVRDLSAQRSGDHVALSWTMPARTTDKLPLKGPVTAQICRREGNGSCDLLPQQRAAANAAASYDDLLPQRLASGGARLVTYTIALKNHEGKSAGASNAAFVAGGSAPPVMQGLRAEVRNEGVVLSWEPAAGATGSAWTVRIQRMRMDTPAPQAVPSAAPANKHANARDAGEREQVLLVKASGRAGLQQALDRTAVFGETYRYLAQRQEEMELDGHTVLTWSAPSQPVTVAVKDVFPPAAPADLAAVADAGAHAVDLSWTPNTEADLAGYVVYRRTVSAPGTATIPQRISPAGAPVQAPAFRDSNAQPGERYAYSVAAVDVRGNESQRSEEAEESLPR
ncbi:MAG: fibronectin type III domain-containing protein, partial [Acidobacteriaceae bacterium]